MWPVLSKKSLQNKKKNGVLVLHHPYELCGLGPATGTAPSVPSPWMGLGLVFPEPIGLLSPPTLPAEVSWSIKTPQCKSSFQKTPHSWKTSSLPLRFPALPLLGQLCGFNHIVWCVRVSVSTAGLRLLEGQDAIPLSLFPHRPSHRLDTFHTFL